MIKFIELKTLHKVNLDKNYKIKLTALAEVARAFYCYLIIIVSEATKINIADVIQKKHVSKFRSF